MSRATTLDQRRVLVIHYSQSGQLAKLTKAFCEPLEEAGHELHYLDLQPQVAYPFPWKVRSFFGLFPETVREVPVALAPFQLPPGAWDRIIVASPIWFLSPCQPLASFFQLSQAEVFRGHRVLTLVGCRNMWVAGWRRIAGHIQSRGGRVTDHVVVTHSGSVFASYFSTLAWLLTGKRDALKPLPKAEMARDAVRRVAEFGRLASTRLDQERLLEGEQTAQISHQHALGEQVVARIFPVLAAIYARTSRPGSVMRSVYAWIQMVLTLGLVFGLFLPCLLFRLLFRRVVDPWLNGLAGIRPPSSRSSPTKRVPASA